MDLVVIFVIGLVIGLLLGWFLLAGDTEGDMYDDEDATLDTRGPDDRGE